MKIVAAVFADFEESFLGASHLRAALGSRTVIGSTLARLMRVEGLAGRCLFVRPRDEDAARSATRAAGLETEIDVVALDDGHRPRRLLMRSARKWNLESWRCSVLSSTWFDEYVEPRAVARVLDHYACEAVLCLEGHQPALDPGIAAAMVAHQTDNAAEADLCFTQAPPGLAGVILRSETTRELLQQELPLGFMLGYRPEIAQPDPITRAACHQIDTSVAQTAARLTGDTRRSRELLSAAFAELGEDVGAGPLCAWLRRDGNARAGTLPVEVELELTTDDPLPETTLRPRGRRVPTRQLEDLDAVARIAEQLAAYDDRLLFLGGHGDPLLHPRFDEICRIVRDAGVCGLGVATTLVELPDTAFEALFAHHVDVVSVSLDANNAESYRQLHNVDHFERVIANVERIEAARRERLSPQPLVISGMTRCAATLPELEPFFDNWIRKTGSVAVYGYNAYCGVLPPDSALPLTPPIRGPCRRLGSRLLLLADGRVARCGQDVSGGYPLGDWRSESLPAIWAGSALHDLREAHREHKWAGLPLCEVCSEWFRP
ncbi:MAG: radical SAM protein [Planctomycetes bacterium]|nr:radical SAM protein [Planctomycetota bacterium]